MAMAGSPPIGAGVVIDGVAGGGDVSAGSADVWAGVVDRFRGAEIGVTGGWLRSADQLLKTRWAVRLRL
jgi:hypothetical protein